MGAFADALTRILDRVPETRLVMITGTDAIPIERAEGPLGAGAGLDAVAAEYTTVLRTAVSTSADTGLGDLRELTVVTESMTALLVAITPEYFLFAALAPDALVGRARFVLRLASLALVDEFA